MAQVLIVAGWVSLVSTHACGEDFRPHGLGFRPAVKAYLSMPHLDGGQLPHLLSQTGAFKDTPRLVPQEGLIPYNINFSFWSDGAAKSRWIAIPTNTSVLESRIGFHATGEWTFPPGTVFVKHFEIRTDETRALANRRLETRLLVRDSAGSVYGATYKWRADNSEADLLLTNLTETILIKTAGGTRTQMWYYPSRQDCRTCHTDRAGGVLGVNTRQMNCDFQFPGGILDNQLRAWNHIGLFQPEIEEAQLSNFPRLAPFNETSRSLEDRARSYLDANCAHCHRPGGTVAFFDARYETRLAQQEMVDGPVRFNQGLDKARVIAANDPWRSVALLRVESLGGDKMPPLAHNVLDQQAATLLQQWIASLPGPKVLAPPGMIPAAGKYALPIEVTLNHEDPDANIHYTLDGSVPTASDALYERPIKLTGPVTVRAKAFKKGCTRSITTQQTFIIGD